MESLHYKVAFTQFPLMLLTLVVVVVDDVVNVVEKDMGVGVSEEVDSAQTNQGSTNSQTDNNNNNQPGATTQTNKQVGRGGDEFE